MEHICIDIETFSSVDIKDCGAYKYALSDDFEILLIAYAIDFGEVKVIDLARGDSIPSEFITAIKDSSVIKHAYNAPFEWFCLKQFGLDTDISEWRDTMFHSLYLGFPASLGAAGKALGLEEDKQKDREGKALVKYFCCPCKPTKANGRRTRNLPDDDLDKWKQFIEYNRQDVVAEMSIYMMLAPFPVPETEQILWQDDIEMNARGILVDMELVEGAIELNDLIKESLLAKGEEISGLDNPNSPAQIKEYVNSRGVDMEDTTKSTVATLLDDGSIPDDVRSLLEIRQELGMASVSKYKAMENAECSDGRVRGLLQFYGANRTGRWAGRLVQVQNLPRNYIEPIGIARELVKNRDFASLEILFGSVPNVLKELIRTAFIPSKYKLVVSDFSAIEARIIAWLAGEKWVQDVFATHGKIYEATASQMFGVDIDLISKGNPEYALRQKGKIAQLALGYQGSVGALKAMGALNMGLTEEELPELVDMWRRANPNIVKLWYRLGDMALNVMMDNRPRAYKGVTFYKRADVSSGISFLAVKLPSGRSLHYPFPEVRNNKFGRPAVHYMEWNTGQWREGSTYGGKLTENIVQAIARDCLAVNLRRIKLKCPEVDLLMHIHDEVVLDAPKDFTVDDINKVLSEPIEWAEGLILTADGFESMYYMKD